MSNEGYVCISRWMEPERMTNVAWYFRGRRLSGMIPGSERWWDWAIKGDVEERIAKAFATLFIIFAIVMTVLNRLNFSQS